MSNNYRPSFTEQFAHVCYSLLTTLIVCLSALPFLLKAPFIAATARHRKLQRFGFIGSIRQTGGLLLHCVSVGEVVAASAIVKRIRETRPDYPVVITTTTATGAERVTQLFGQTVEHRYLPYDVRFVMKRLLRQVKPQKVLITEVELWPNLLHECWQQRIPCYIVNARMTDKSAKNYRKLQALFNPMLQKISGVCAQGQRDFDNYRLLGLADNKLYLSNNIKFDLTLSDQEQTDVLALRQKLATEHRTILLGASTHSPEEEALIEAYRQLKSHNPELLLILTPRHPERFAKVAALIQEKGLALQTFSAQQPVAPDTDVLLVDAMGVLKQFYGIANIAFVGGSLAPRGGHNALEAALFSVPIIMGPHYENNPAICEALITAGALKIANDPAQLCQWLDDWLKHKQTATTLGKQGQKVLADNAGAIDKTLAIIDL